MTESVLVLLVTKVRVELSWTTPNSAALSGRRVAASDSVEQTRNFSMGGANHLKVVERVSKDGNNNNNNNKTSTQRTRTLTNFA